jgi:hypothetical protein
MVTRTRRGSRSLEVEGQAAEIAKLAEALAISNAKGGVLANALRAALGIIDRAGGFMAAEDQHVYRAAKALLAQLGL